MILKRLAFVVVLCFVPSLLFSNSLYFPQVAFRGGYTTSVTIMNTGTAAVASEFKVFSQMGTLLMTIPVSVPAGGSTRFNVVDTGAETINSWGVLNAGIATVEGVATFDLRSSSGKLTTTGGVLGVEAGNSFLLPVDVTDTADTGLAIANIHASSAVAVDLELLSENGSLVATANYVPLRPLG